MGKSDPILFRWYISHIKTAQKSIAFLGFNGENNFSRIVNGIDRDFYDLSLGNWNINDEEWNIAKKYDAVICTRCAYFAKDPEKFIANCHKILNDNGHLLVDWGLGDHWRFEEYKVCWVKNEEHEYCYGEDNFLWSTVWHESFLNHSECQKFSEWIKKKKYDDLEKAINDEVPSILSPEKLSGLFKSVMVDMVSLWEESPQLYILLSCVK